MSSTRSASLRVAHSRGCPKATRTSLESLKGCTCKPSYYTAHRGPDGKVVKSERVRDREVANRALRKLQVSIDEGRAGVSRTAKVPFNEWADGFPKILEQAGRRGATIRAYTSTINYGKATFGGLYLSAIGNGELRRFVQAIRDTRKEEEGKPARGGGDAVVAKHLRHLSAMLEQAVEDGLLDVNPVPRFRRKQKLVIPKGTPPYSNIELATLFAKLATLKTPAVYVTIIKTAVTTGARIGELIALEWQDLDLLHKQVRIRHTWDAIDGKQLPKDGEERIVYLTPAAVALLEAWTAKQGVRADDEPVFTAPRSGGRIDQRYLHRLIDDALTKASISKVGEDGRPRKPLHSLRATFTRIMRESGVDPAFVQASLGHSTLDLTENVYGRWGAAAMRSTADHVDAGRFPV